MTHRLISRRLALSAGLGGVAAAGGLGAGGLGRAAFAAGATAPGPGAADLLFHDPEFPVLGNKLGTLSIAEFFDYRCPYCHQMEPRLRRLLAADQGIRLVAKEWPVFGGPSVTAARVALAANWQGRFAAVHEALFQAPAPLDEAKIRAAAQGAGVDMARLDRDLSHRSADLDRILARVAAEAAALKLEGTPGFVVGMYLVPGALSYEDLLKVVADARAKMKAAG